mmetsp:Transcript_5879/g.6445  ORF Transcript_5879/g.6445 Transcript_5879/m.6445 type:complete len:165 (-) Transcript_5879:74-568(-)
MKSSILWVVVVTLFPFLSQNVSSFVHPLISSSSSITNDNQILYKNDIIDGRRGIEHPQRQQQGLRKSVQLYSLFGLGAPEIAIILVAVVLVVGPESIGNLVRDSGKIASEYKNELKDIPKEFSKGLEEGEINARARNAKPMKTKPVKLKTAEKVKKDDNDDEKE